MCKRLAWLLAVSFLAPAVRGEEYETVELPSVYHAYGSAVTGDSKTLFVVATTGVALMYDVEEDRYVRGLDLRDHVVRPTAAAIANGKLYVYSFRDLLILDVETQEVTDLVPLTPYLGSSFGSVVASPGEDRIYAIGGSTTDLTVLDTATDEVVARLEIGGDHTGMALSPDGGMLYVSHGKEDRLLLVATHPLEVVGEATFAAGHEVESYGSVVRMDPTDGRAFVAFVDERGFGRVSVLEPSGELIRSMGLDRFSTGLEVSPDGRRLLLGSGLVLDPENGSVIGEFVTPVNGRTSVTVSPDGRRAYVANVNDNLIRAVEGMGPALEVEGSPADGQPLTVRLHLPEEAGRRFQIAASLGTDRGVRLPDGRIVPIDSDGLMRFSMDPDNEVFLGFTGELDSEGRAEATIDLTGDFPGKRPGRQVHLCFVTLEERIRREDVREISNVVSFTLEQ